MAQFDPPVTIDESATQGAQGIFSTRNTGNDVAEYNNTGDEMRVMVWDDLNATAKFAWEESGTLAVGNKDLDGNNLGTVYDPDIVVSSDGNFLYVVYELDFTDIYYEGWRYNSFINDWILVDGPTQVNTNTPAHNPNIDVNRDQMANIDRMVIVWEEGNRIYAIAGDFSNGFLPTYSQVNLQNTQHAFWPDVSLFYNIQTGAMIAKFTYLQDDGNNWHLYVQEEAWSDIASGIVVPNQTNLFTAAQNVLGRPRIASSEFLNDDTNYTIVFRETYNSSGTQYFINVFTMFNGSLYFFQPLPDSFFPADLSQPCANYVLNDEPVVVYHYELVYIAWTYDDNCFGYTGGEKEVIVAWKDLAGGVYSGNNFLLANSTPVGNQYTPSLAGRFSPQENILYTFYDEFYSDIRYKASHWLNSPIRVTQDSKNFDLSLYPNPATDFVNISSSDASINKIDFYDLQGRLIKTVSIKENNKSIDISGLSNGVYVLGIEDQSGNSTTVRLNVIR
ncbi:MAG: T9SS type A sorting domain-containing protein [Nitrosopumilus sp.]|nr:T9SS type A sorting domain-containing protein [Nitrosopumilus sp.]